MATSESTSERGRAELGRKPRAPRAAAATPTRARRTRVEILKSAAAAFRRLGYHGATVEEIAAALHMKKGNLYYYFRNKEEILFACHQYSLDRLLALLDDVEQSGLPPDEKLRRLIVAFVHTILDELHGTALFLDLEALSPAHLKDGRSRGATGSITAMREMLEGRDPVGHVRVRRREAAVVRDSRRGELDPALVQPRRARRRSQEIADGSPTI